MPIVRNDLGAVLAAGALLAAPAAGEDGLERAVVRIFVTQQKPDYYQPWQMGPQETSSGSGCILPGGRILTNAHVVGDQTYVQVRKAGDSTRHVARLEFVAHDSELATLRVDDPAFLRDTVPLELGELPRQRDRVAAYGFPEGGEDLSITEGIVSRIEVTEYAHSARELLALQTDAAINLGSSGGPVVKGGRLIGVSFQTYSGSGVENTAYIVPAPIIGRFLKDIEDGRYDGIPDIGVYWAHLENESLRRRYGSGPERTGILVNAVVYGSPAWGELQDGDVLTAVDGVPISGDGTYAPRKGQRLLYTHLFALRQMGEKVPLSIVRGGRPLGVSVTLRGYRFPVDGPLYDHKPSYFIFGGLVFTPLTRNYIALWKPEEVPVAFKALEEFGLPSPERRQAVVLSHVLPHDVNAGYHEFRNIVVDSVNGVRVADMETLVRVLGKPQGDSHVIRTDPVSDFGGRIVLDAREAAAAGPEILARYGIPADRSQDLK